MLASAASKFALVALSLASWLFSAVTSLTMATKPPSCVALRLTRSQRSPIRRVSPIGW